MAKKHPQLDLEKVASQLAKVRLLARAGKDGLTITATATFSSKSFEAGDYRVSVGIKQALLQLEHPSFEMGNAYQATLSDETWSQSWKKLKESQAEGKVEVTWGAKLRDLVGFGVGGKLSKNSQVTAVQESNAPYSLVITVPMGWQIGTELGDPRVAEGMVPEGLEYCLQGEYLSGRQDEKSDGLKDDTGKFVLCSLTPSRGNDPRIVGTLFGAAGSLVIKVHPLRHEASKQGLGKVVESSEREETLRKAFVAICINRAEQAEKEGARTDAMLSGELYLNSHEIHAPQVPGKVLQGESGKKDELGG